MTDPGHAARLWTDRSFLRDVQYKTDVNLVARQSIYAYQRPPADLPREIRGLAGLSGHEVVADIGCGNGRYLAELARRGHAGRVAGNDLSPGMLNAARRGHRTRAWWSPMRPRCPSATQRSTSPDLCGGPAGPTRRPAEMS